MEVEQASVSSAASDSFYFHQYAASVVEHTVCSENDVYSNMTLAEINAHGLAHGYGEFHSKYLTIALPIFLATGIIDNAAFIFVVTRLSSMRTATNRYLVNLAISDILFLTCSIGEKLWRFAKSPYYDDDSPLGQWGCVLLPFLIDVSFFASLCFITLVSAEIYFAVCYPRGKSLIQQRSCSLMFSIGSWVISGVVAGLICPFNAGFTQLCFNLPDREPYKNWPETFAICTVTYPWMDIVIDLTQWIPFLVTLSINAVLYLKIILGLNQSIHRLRSHCASKRDGDTQLRNQIARMLVVNGIIFFICLSPFEILSFLKTFQIRPPGHIVHGVRALLYINSIVNPIIYTTMSQRYREAFKSTFMNGQACKILGTVPPRAAVPSSTQTYFKMSQITRI